MSSVTNGYCAPEELAGYLRNVDITTNSGPITDAINEASRQIDAYCGRRFFLDASASNRTYWTNDTRVLIFDDATSVTSIKLSTGDNGTYDLTYTAGTDYTLEPLNGRGSGLEGLPYWRARFTTDVLPTNTSTPCAQINATWGWAAVPEPVRQACLIMASEAFKLAEAPFGVAGFGEMGVVRVGKMSPKAADMLRPYRTGDSILGAA